MSFYILYEKLKKAPSQALLTKAIQADLIVRLSHVVMIVHQTRRTRNNKLMLNR